MAEPEANANNQEPRAPLPQEPWHDKVLVDTIGYTKGLVAILDSLSEGFQRRGRELEEHRNRLAILQSERRTLLEGRSEFDARITALTAERDGFRTALADRQRELDDQRARLAILQDERRTSLQERSEFDARITALTAERDGLRAKVAERERELDTLRQDVAQGQAALEAQAREIQVHRAGMAETVRQAEELREVVRSLERQLQRAGRLPPRAPVLSAPGEPATPSGTRAMPQLDVAAFEELFSDRRRAEDTQGTARTAERDGLRAKVEERDREIEEQRDRLATLQSEWRAVLEERSEFDARITALAEERDGFRSTLEERERELDTLRQEATQGQVALEAQAREIQALRVGMAETVRQAEEIQKVLQALERESESAAERQAVLEETLEAERRQVRETATRTSQEQFALREDLADAENVLAEARKDIAASQGLIASLQRAADEEHVRNAMLKEQLEAQTGELAHLRATMHAGQTLLDELASAFGGSPDASGKELKSDGRAPARLEAPVQGPAAATHPDDAALAIVQPILETFRDLLPPAEGAVTGPLDLATDEAAVRRRADQIADQWRRLLRTRAESVRPEEPARQQGEPVSEHGAAAVGDRDARPEGERVASAPDDRATAGEAPQGAKQEATPTPVVASSVGQKTSKRPGSTSGMTVECTVPAPGTETARILRGEIARINDMGLLGAFEERLPEGLQIVVRFVRDGEVVSCLGRVVRVQESTGAPNAPVTLNHLIRFESPVSASGEALQTFVN